MGDSDGYVDTLVLLAGDGQVAARYNIVLVAEGYSKTDAGTFFKDAQAICNTVLAEPPFAALASSINVFRLDVWSTESGADVSAKQVKTYFNAAFDDTTTQLLRVDEALVVKTVQQALSDNAVAGHAHKMIVVVNTDSYGGSGGIGAGVCVASRETGAITLLHELGHLFGLLDEYDSASDKHAPPSHAPPAPPKIATSPNISMSCNYADLPWKDLVDPATPLPTEGPNVTASTVGAFEVEDEGSTAYRPQWQCRMRHLKTDAFCVVCARHIAQTLKTAL